MNALFLSMTVGKGHNSASNAIRNHLEKRGHVCDMLDTYKFLNRAIGEALDKGYTFLGRFWPRLNETIYSQAEKYNGRSDMKLYFPWLFADINKNKMQKYINDTQPDVIICSIVMTAILVTLLKEADMISKEIKTVGIVTDYSLHPFWEYTDMDYFVCPNELMLPSVTRRGIPEAKLIPTGIPIDEKFTRKLPQTQARDKLGLAQKKYTILMSSGGMGFAGLMNAAQELDELDDLQLVAVCGTNKQLFSRMQDIKFRNQMCVLKFVDNMDEYMDACDLFITKPGGLSTAEAIAKRKPLLLAQPMPGVENMNLTFLVNHSLAVQANKYQPLREVIAQMLVNPYKLEEMRIAQTRFGKPDSARKLGEFLERLIHG